jgi:dihydroflavonol-4-reductase
MELHLWMRGFSVHSEPTKTVLITGATGFLGKHLVRQIQETETDARLRVLCRGASPWEGQGEIEAVRGDVTSLEDVHRAVAGVDEIYHLAGAVSRNAQDKWLLYQTHIGGTRNICESARRDRLRKVVVVSSSGTIAVSREPVPHQEDSGYKHELVGEWPYYLSKVFAEKVALTYYRQYQLPVVIVNPSLLLGPGDDRRSSTGDVDLFLRGQIRAIPSGGLNFIDVRDAAHATIAAMRSGRPGERYLLGGQNWTFQEFIRHLSDVSGVPAPKLRLPLGLSLISARLLREIMPWVGKEFALDDASIRMSALFWYCDSSKARSELGLESRNPEDTLRDTVASLRATKGPGTRSPLEH